jgi:hypothetical protein
MTAGYARAAGIASLIAGVDILFGIAVTGVVTPNYDATRDLISASQLGPYGALVTLSLAAGGLLTIVLALILSRILPPGSQVGPALLLVRGWGTLMGGAFQADIGPVRSLGGFLHVAGFIGGAVAFGIALFFIAVRMRGDPDWRGLSSYTFATALATLAMLGLFVALGPKYVGDTAAPLSAIGGLVQRAQTIIAWSWHIVIGAWLLRSSRAAAQI